MAGKRQPNGMATRCPSFELAACTFMAQILRLLQPSSPIWYCFRSCPSIRNIRLAICLAMQRSCDRIQQTQHTRKPQHTINIHAHAICQHFVCLLLLRCVLCCAVLCVPLRNGELDSALQGGNRIALVVLTRHWRQYMLGLCLCCCYCASCTSCSNNTTSIFIFITHSFCRFIMCCCCKSSSYFFTIFLILITGSTQVRQQNFEKR